MTTTRRGLGLVLALGLLVGGAAACSDDEGGGGDAGGTSTTAAPTTAAPTTAGDQQPTTTAAEGGGDTGGEGETTTAPEGEATAGNDAVIQEYCDAVEANNAALDASLANPEDEAAQDALAEASGRLGEASDAVSALVENFTPEQQAQFEECSDALSEG